MALPQRKDPDLEEPRRDYGALPAERPVRGTSAGFAWWWVMWLVIIGLFIWWAGWGWGGSGGWWWGNRGGYAGAGTTAGGAVAPASAGNAAGGAGTGVAGGAGTAQMMSGPGVQVLNATDKTSFINQPFQANDVPVQDKVNNQALWIGGNNSNRMLAILSGTGNSAANANIGKGNMVNVTGTVEKAPLAAQARSEWHLSSGEANRLEQEGAYIRASQVTNAQQR